MALIDRLLFESQSKASFKIPPRASMLLSTGNKDDVRDYQEPNFDDFIDTYNDKYPDNPIEYENPLGSGTQGFVFKTKNGVVKVARGQHEHN
jgi:hypothetical protein